MLGSVNRLKIVFVGVVALLIACSLLVASRNPQLPVPTPEVPVVAAPGEVLVKAVERKAEPVEQGKAALASGAVAIVCMIWALLGTTNPAWR